MNAGSFASFAARRSISATAAGALPIQIASRSALTSSFVRPVFTLCGMVLGVPAVDRCVVALVDEQPLLAAVLVVASRPPRGPRAPRPLVRTIVNRPRSFSPASVNLSSPSSTAAPAVGRLRLGGPGAPVPDDDVAAAVLALRDHALEVEVLDRVVFHVHGHAPGARVERRTLGHGPRDEDAVDLQPEVVVQPGRAVALDDEPPGPRGRARDRPAGRLGRLPEVALALVFLERHGAQCGRARRSGVHRSGVGPQR